MSKFLLLLRGGEFEQYSPDEMENILEKYLAWTAKLKEEGVYLAGEELKDSGRVLSAQNDQVVDGPFAETKEAIGGFWMIQAKDYVEAVAVSKECPHLQFKGTVEVREVNPH